MQKRLVVHFQFVLTLVCNIPFQHYEEMFREKPVECPTTPLRVDP